jgi:hypothetical protein
MLSKKYESSRVREALPFGGGRVALQLVAIGQQQYVGVVRQRGG